MYMEYMRNPSTGELNGGKIVSGRNEQWPVGGRRSADTATYKQVLEDVEHRRTPTGRCAVAQKRFLGVVGVGEFKPHPLHRMQQLGFERPIDTLAQVVHVTPERVRIGQHIPPELVLNLFAADQTR